MTSRRDTTGHSKQGAWNIYIIVALVALLQPPIAIHLGHKNGLDENHAALGCCCGCSQYTKRKSNRLFPSVSLASVSC